jgi:hypothetical protein
MKRRTKGVLYLLGFIAFLIGLLLVRPKWQARRPSDMPRNSVWIDAPAVPFGFYHGWWFGCWIDSDHKSNRCKLWGSGGLQTVYEGRYISCDEGSPVHADELQLTAPKDSSEMWVGYSEGNVFAPAAFLRDGKILVPIEAPRACEELREKKARK